MLLTRAFDNKGLSLQRQGRLGRTSTAPEKKAQSYRARSRSKKRLDVYLLQRGGSPHRQGAYPIDLMFAQSFGNSSDLLKGRQMSNSWGSRELNIMPDGCSDRCVSAVGVGVAMGMKIKKKNNLAVLAYMGDGGTSASDFSRCDEFRRSIQSPHRLHLPVAWLGDLASGFQANGLGDHGDKSEGLRL